MDFPSQLPQISPTVPSSQKSKADLDIYDDVVFSPHVPPLSMPTVPVVFDRTNFLKAAYARVKKQQNLSPHVDFQFTTQKSEGNPPSTPIVSYMSKRDFIIKFSAYQSRCKSHSNPQQSSSHATSNQDPPVNIRQVKYPLYHSERETKIIPYLQFEASASHLVNLSNSQLFAYHFHHYNVSRHRNHNLHVELNRHNFSKPNHRLSLETLPNVSPSDHVIKPHILPTLLTKSQLERFHFINYLQILESTPSDFPNPAFLIPTFSPSTYPTIAEDGINGYNYEPKFVESLKALTFLRQNRSSNELLEFDPGWALKLEPPNPETYLKMWVETELQLEPELPPWPRLTNHAHLPSGQSRGQRAAQMKQKQTIKHKNQMKLIGVQNNRLLRTGIISSDITNSMQATSPSLNTSSIFSSRHLQTSRSLRRIPFHNVNHVSTNPLHVFDRMQLSLDRWSKDETYRLRLTSLVYPHDYPKIAKHSLINKTPDDVHWYALQRGLDDRLEDIIRNHAYVRGENFVVDEQELKKREKDEDALKQRWMQTSQILVPALPDKDTSGLSLPQLLKSLPIRPSEHAPISLVVQVPPPPQTVSASPPSPSLSTIPLDFPSFFPKSQEVKSLIEASIRMGLVRPIEPLLGREPGSYTLRVRTQKPRQKDYSPNQDQFYVRYPYYEPSTSSLFVDPNNQHAQSFTYTQTIESIPRLLFESGYVRNEKRIIHPILKSAIRSTPFKLRSTLSDLFFGNGVGAFKQEVQHWDPQYHRALARKRASQKLETPIDSDTMSFVQEKSRRPKVNEQTSTFGQVDGIWFTHDMRAVVDEDMGQIRPFRTIRSKEKRKLVFSTGYSESESTGDDPDRSPTRTKPSPSPIPTPSGSTQNNEKRKRGRPKKSKMAGTPLPNASPSNASSLFPMVLSLNDSGELK